MKSAPVAFSMTIELRFSEQASNELKKSGKTSLNKRISNNNDVQSNAGVILKRSRICRQNSPNQRPSLPNAVLGLKTLLRSTFKRA